MKITVGISEQAIRTAWAERAEVIEPTATVDVDAADLSPEVRAAIGAGTGQALLGYEAALSGLRWVNPKPIYLDGTACGVMWPVFDAVPTPAELAWALHKAATLARATIGAQREQRRAEREQRDQEQADRSVAQAAAVEAAKREHAESQIEATRRAIKRARKALRALETALSA